MAFFVGALNPFPPSFTLSRLRYVEDKDIWRWALPDSEAFTAAFALVPLTFEAYGALHASGEEGVRDLIEKGKVLVEYRNSVRDSHVRRARPAQLRAAPQFSARIVNCSTLTSEVGNAICVQTGAQLAVMWSFDHEKRNYYVSLRSNSDDVDVSAIARSLGGGGHKRAAGFSHTGASIEEILLFQ